MAEVILKTYQDFNRPRVRDLPKNIFLEAPKILEAGVDTDSAFAIILSAFGFSETIKELEIETPIECISINCNLLHHVIEKRLDARERFSNFIKPTLKYPFEIYTREYDTGFRKQYIGLFQGKENIMVVVNTGIDGKAFFWNMMQTDKRKIDKHRVGELIWAKKLCP
jgi:hypothetical protein